MPITLTASQQQALSEQYAKAVAALKVDFDTASDWLFCTGRDSVTIGGDVYVPGRLVSWKAFRLDSPGNATISCTLDDRDGVLASVWYGTERATGKDATFSILVDGVSVLSVPWYVVNQSRSGGGYMQVMLAGAAGLRPRAGLLVGDRNDFEWAPGEGDKIPFTWDGGLIVGGGNVGSAIDWQSQNSSWYGSGGGGGTSNQNKVPRETVNENPVNQNR